jgi:uncharacterized protein
MDTETPRPAPADPVSSSERVMLLDVLRGYALWGVLMSNVYWWFSGRHIVPPERIKEFSENNLYIALQILQNHLIGGKFISIFSFLFGLGLAMQFGRAEERNDSPVKRYARRGGTMVAFGLIHLVAIWQGDVLLFYAELGLVVLLVRRVAPRKLLFLGLFLAVVFPILFMWGTNFLPKLWTSKEALDAAAKAQMAEMATLNAKTLSTLSGQSYLAIMKANVEGHIQFLLRRHTVLNYIEFFGKMLLGFYAGKIGLFHHAEANRKTFRRLLGWGLLIGLLCTITRLLLGFVFKVPPGTEPPVYRQILMPFVFNLQTAAMACFYVGAISLLFLRPMGHRVVSIFAPVGRMAVTNYLMQSVVAQLYFTGLGFGRVGKLTPLDTHVFPICLFMVQIVASRFWLKRFEFGPVEWLWRYFTYGKASRMRKVPDAVPSVVEA